MTRTGNLSYTFQKCIFYHDYVNHWFNYHSLENVALMSFAGDMTSWKGWIQSKWPKFKSMHFYYSLTVLSQHVVKVA